MLATSTHLLHADISFNQTVPSTETRIMTPLSAIAEETAKVTKAAKADLRQADRRVIEATELIFLGICLRNIQNYVGFYHKKRIALVNGGFENEPDVNVDSFASWLASRKHWRSYSTIDLMDPGVIVDQNTLLIYERSAFSAPVMLHEAAKMLAPIWLKRLPNIVKALNEHPLTDGLPEIGFWINEKPGFNFTIHFIVE